ncbi:MAG: DUF3748 domain-containing protein [Gemmataceae bacterium]
MIHETQLTNAPHGHILTNTAVWSPDSKWIVYDVRSDPAGSVFDGTRIERIHIESKRIERLYESKNGACVGVPTVNPVTGEVVFIHGPENPAADWSYSACHREGSIVDPAKPGVAIPLEARDIVPPFTRFALRGGTHVHTWDDGGCFVSFTYEDHVLTHGTAPGKEPNRRTIGMASPFNNCFVPKTHPRNRDGSMGSEIVVKTVPHPEPGSDEIGRAFEDGWIPGQNAITFIGEVVATDGRRVNELFLMRFRSLNFKGEVIPLSVETAMPEPRMHFKQYRLTHYAEIEGHAGLTVSPRHWPRTSPDGKRVAYLTGNGQLNLLTLPTALFEIWQIDEMHKAQSRRWDCEIRTLPVTVSSAFTWHPNGRDLAAIVEGKVCLIEMDHGKVTALTAASVPPPRPEACVASPDGTKLAYVKTVYGFNQIFIVDVPADRVK